MSDTVFYVLSLLVIASMLLVYAAQRSESNREGKQS
jgi:hypothetical protein